MGGGTVEPQSPSLSPATPMLPETEPLWLGFDFFGPQCPLPPRVYKRNAPPPPPPHPHQPTPPPPRARPPTPPTSSAPSHPLPPLLPTPPSDGAPEMEPKRLNFGFLAPQPLLPLAFANATSHHHHPIHTTALPHPTDIHA